MNEELVMHNDLAGRDAADQHPITAITGLRTELDQIDALKTVYSDQIGIANYYKWSDDTRDHVGYFVSLVPQTSTIKICDGTNIFGVTVDAAGFVGGQDGVTLDYLKGLVDAYGVARDNSYGLVVTSGLVDVRCELSVVGGDYVISNAYGMAEKTVSGCGYKVIAINNKFGIPYATISLGVQACTTDSIGKELQRLKDDLRNAEINIAAAINTANAAHDKATESNSVSEDAVLKALEALDKFDITVNTADITNAQLEIVKTTTAQAKAIAEGAVARAESIKQETSATVNDALSNVNAMIDKLEPLDEWVDPTTGKVGAEYIVKYMDAQGLATKEEILAVEDLTEQNKTDIKMNADGIQTLVSSVDKYSVGKYSQAYGLTIEQARNILKPDMIYIPTPHGDDKTHTESYEGSSDRDFTNGFYYVWTELADGFGWSEERGEVWFGKQQPAGSAYTYWYDGANLFLLSDGQWVEVATLAGNVNNRITSMIRQDVDSISMTVTNTIEALAEVQAEVTDTSAKVNSIAAWPSDDDTHMLATIEQVAGEDGSRLALAAVTSDGTKILEGATIVLDNTADSSVIQIDADHLVFASDGATFVSKDNLSTAGQTEINGANITTGQIKSVNFSYREGDPFSFSGSRIDLTNGNIITPNFNVKDGNTTLSGAIHATSGYIGESMSGWTINSNGLYHAPLGSDIDQADMLLCPGSTESFSIAGSDWIDGWMIKAGESFGVTQEGTLYCSDAFISGAIHATVGSIGSESSRWEITATGLYYTSDTSSAAQERNCLFLCTGSVENFDIAGSGLRDGWMLKAGEKFGVTTEGFLYCNEAHMEGEITANSGRIGQWSIEQTDDGRGFLYADNGDYRSFLQAPDASNPSDPAWVYSIQKKLEGYDDTYTPVYYVDTYGNINTNGQIIRRGFNQPFIYYGSINTSTKSQESEVLVISDSEILNIVSQMYGSEDVIIVSNDTTVFASNANYIRNSSIITCMVHKPNDGWYAQLSNVSAGALIINYVLYINI